MGTVPKSRPLVGRDETARRAENFFEKWGFCVSNVLKNRRSISELEFYQNAIRLRAELTRFILSEKNVPKSYRLYFALPMKQKLSELFDNITAANTIYPSNEHELQLRRDYQTKAIITCEQILQELHYMISVLPINVDRLNPEVEMLLKEVALLKAWRKSSKVLRQKQ